MTIQLNGRLDEQATIIQATSMVALATTGGDASYVSLKGYHRMTIIISILNATTVTATDVTLKQATAVAGTGEKELAFTRMLANVDLAAGQTYTETSVSSNTFATNTTNSKRLCYILEVNPSSLDVAGGFDCVRVDGANGVNSTGLVTYILWGKKSSAYTQATALAD